MPSAISFQHFEVELDANGAARELGRGAMGVTYKAFDTKLQRSVALKVINAGLLHSEMAQRRFLREARAAARLHHPNVATVYDLGTTGEDYYYAMEFIEGETLEGYVRRGGPLPPSLALRVALQVARALGAAWKEGLVHRDIKPANLMLAGRPEELAGEDLQVKVIDFGLARAAGDAAGDLGGLTGTGMVGTPHFASPEQLEEKGVDIRADIYSLGATIWYLLAGKPPFSGSSVFNVISQHLNRPPPFETLAGVPEPMVTLLTRMLAKDPADRQADPTVLRREIEDCLRKVDPAAPGIAGSGGSSGSPSSPGSAGSSGLTGMTADRAPSVSTPVLRKITSLPPPPMDPAMHASGMGTANRTAPPPFPVSAEDAALVAPPALPRRKGRFGVAVAVLLILAGGAGAAIWYLRSRPSLSRTAIATPSVAPSTPAPAKSAPIPTRTLLVPDQFPFIHAAVAAANAGDTVKVKAGIYEEQIAFKEGINLVGEGSNTTVVRCRARQGNVLFAKQCGSGLISDIGFEHIAPAEAVAPGSRRLPVIFLDGSAIQILNCNIRYSGGNGMVITRGDHSMIDRCEFSGCAWSGAWLSGAGTASVLKGNVSRFNGNSGLLFTEGAGGSAESNTCEQNGKIGINIEGAGTAPTLIRNRLRYNAGAGIHYSLGAGGLAQGNLCMQNFDSGIGLSGANTNPVLKGNHCNGNGGWGIFVQPPATADIADDNVATGNRAGGISK